MPSADRLRRAALLLLALPLGLLAPGCDQGCLKGGADCRLPSPCTGFAFACPDGDALEVRLITAEEPGPGGVEALGAVGDVLLANGRVEAVIAGIGNQNYLDPSGGSILDLANRGHENDGISQILQVVGILPGDSVHYTAMELIDERPARVAIQLRGSLFERPEIPVYTLYEVRPCEPGIRVRTEIVNGSADQQLWTLSDGYYWSSRSALPFTPGEGAGFEHPSFGLLTIDDAFRSAPFLAASTHSGVLPASYAVVGCQEPLLEGFHSATVSSAGLRRSVIPPRDYQVYERFITVQPRPDVAGAADVALSLHASLHGTRSVTVEGQVERTPPPIAGERTASILISEGRLATPAGARVPWTQVVPDASGFFSARVPAGRDYVVEVHAFGRKVLEREFAAVSEDRDLGVFPIASSTRLIVTVTDPAGTPLAAEVFVVPADDASASGVAGSLHGQFERCAPWLGPPNGTSPACNRFLVAPWAPAAVELPPGSYHLYAYHGPFHTLARISADLPEGDVPLPFILAPLPLRPADTVSADLHVHGAASFDSSIPDPDRVLSFAAADVDVLIATDHDVVYDYSELVEQLGFSGWMSAVAGVETTGHIPFFKIPGSPFPRVIGHYNFWPLAYRADLPRNGGPFDELIEPGELFDRVEPLYTGTPLAQLNHPWAPTEFGRDLGFPRALALDLTVDLPAEDDGTAAGMYQRVPAGGHRNDDHHAQEVMNGSANDIYLQYRAFWFYTLNQGRLKTGTANSDSHGLTDNTVGTPRNVVHARTHGGPDFDVDRLNTAIREGAVLGTNGPIILATIADAAGEERSFGLSPFRPAPGAKLKLEVSAAPWVPVDEIRIVVNGVVVRTLDGAALSRPADPFGEADLVRYLGEIALDELLPASGDAWLVVEAGAPLPLAADLGGGEVSDEFPRGKPDGVPDTSDNNGDGKVDEADIAEDEDVGPLRSPAPPTSDTDPGYHFAQVTNGGRPAAFTNPFVLDRDGNGRFDAPGARRNP